jgi:hypothetical protein
VPNGVLLLLRLLASAGAAAAISWLGWKLGGKSWMLIALVFSSPLIGVAIARPLVELTHEGFGWLSAQPLQEWEGAYYAFNGVHVRIYEQGDKLLFVARDVLEAIGIPAALAAVHSRRMVRIPGTRHEAFSVQALEALLAGRTDHEAGRFLLWARRDVVAPWEKKRAAAR